MYQLTFLGLIAVVDVTSEGALVLLPDGVDCGDDIPDHHARFYIENDRIVDATGWWTAVDDVAMKKRCVTVFPIEEPSELTFTGMEEILPPQVCDGVPVPRDNSLDADRYTALMPSFRDLDKRFKVDPQGAKTIARFTIRRATLYAHFLTEAAVSTAFVYSDPGPVTITARTRDGKTKTLIVKEGTEILLANMSDLGAPYPANAPSHINIYRRLDPTFKRVLKEPGNLNSSLTPLYGPSRHPFVQYILDTIPQVPRPGCSSLVYSSKGTGCRFW